jgi:NADH-quinone oxidoreductase subunit K
MAGATLAHYLFVSAAMFALGLIGFMTRRNLIIMFLCTELMFQAAGLALIAFGRYHLNFDGQTFVIFVLTIAAAEAAMALALVVLLFRKREIAERRGPVGGAEGLTAFLRTRGTIDRGHHHRHPAVAPRSRWRTAAPARPRRDRGRAVVGHRVHPVHPAVRRGASSA